MSMTRILTLLFISLIISFTDAQDFDLSTNSANLEINGKSFSGFESTFPNPQDKIEKALWKYARTFSKLTNERTHFQIIIPEELNREVNTDLRLYAKILPARKGSSVLLAMSDDLSSEERQRFDPQVRRLLLDFKRFFYHETLKDQIKILESSIHSAGERYESKRQMGLAGEEELSAIANYQDEIALLEGQIKELLLR